MTRNEHHVRFRVRWTDEAGSRQVSAVADLAARTVTFTLPDGIRATVDAVEARALAVALRESVYDALQPEGPSLRTEKTTDADDREPA